MNYITGFNKETDGRRERRQGLQAYADVAATEARIAACRPRIRRRRSRCVWAEDVFEACDWLRMVLERCDWPVPVVE